MNRCKDPTKQPVFHGGKSFFFRFAQMFKQRRVLLANLSGINTVDSLG